MYYKIIKINIKQKLKIKVEGEKTVLNNNKKTHFIDLI